MLNIHSGMVLKLTIVEYPEVAFMNRFIKGSISEKFQYVRVAVGALNSATASFGYGSHATNRT